MGIGKLEFRIQNWDLGLENWDQGLEIKIEDRVWVSGIGIGDWD